MMMNREYPEIPAELLGAWETYQHQRSNWLGQEPEMGGCDDFWSSYNPRIDEEHGLRVAAWAESAPTPPPCLDSVLAERQAINSAAYELEKRQKALKDKQAYLARQIRQAAEAVKKKEQTKIKAAATRAKTKLKKERSKAVMSTLILKPKPHIN